MSGADASSATPALELEGLRKTFGHHRAVDRVSLTVPSGSFFGLVGPNGAGKTTTLAMATGLLRPDGGRARVLGVDVWRDRAHAQRLLGLLPDGLGLPEQLTGREALTYLGLLRGLDRDTVHDRGAELLELLDLPTDERRGALRVIGGYSTGMRKKLGLAVALLHAPRLLVLDEPLEAVDPVSAATIKSILRDVVDTGGSVVLSSHVMALVEQLCDRVAILHDGRLLASGALDAVSGGRPLEAAFVSLVGAERDSSPRLSWLSDRSQP